jgi:hypothetical protein
MGEGREIRIKTMLRERYGMMADGEGRFDEEKIERRDSHI